MSIRLRRFEQIASSVRAEPDGPDVNVSVRVMNSIEAEHSRQSSIERDALMVSAVAFGLAGMAFILFMAQDSHEDLLAILTCFVEQRS